MIPLIIVIVFVGLYQFPDPVLSLQKIWHSSSIPTRLSSQWKDHVSNCKLFIFILLNVIYSKYILSILSLFVALLMAAENSIGICLSVRKCTLHIWGYILSAAWRSRANYSLPRCPLIFSPITNFSVFFICKTDVRTGYTSCFLARHKW